MNRSLWVHILPWPELIPSAVRISTVREVFKACLTYGCVDLPTPTRHAMGSELHICMTPAEIRHLQMRNVNLLSKWRAIDILTKFKFKLVKS